SDCRSRSQQSRRRPPSAPPPSPGSRSASGRAATTSPIVAGRAHATSPGSRRPRRIGCARAGARPSSGRSSTDVREPPILRGGLLARFASLGAGLLVFACGIVGLLEAKLGLAPWDVLHQGIARHTPLSFGVASIV